ncbi:hypothetical protein EVAR_28114_1 [Eumeta japonica]|uniref:Uncharacterized protein n=1 Tax=Eumeta variegata TaxID=151549 RepID=A0A4C1VDR9_EUMVA|nr:hypothetical protein EVAR_28114_1 [Eumeta japonica]
MSHRMRERPAECLASLSHSTMIVQQLASRWHWLYRRYCACVIPLFATQSGDSCLLRVSALGHLLFVLTSCRNERFVPPARSPRPGPCPPPRSGKSKPIHICMPAQCWQLGRARPTIERNVCARSTPCARAARADDGACRRQGTRTSAIQDFEISRPVPSISGHCTGTIRRPTRYRREEVAPAPTAGAGVRVKRAPARRRVRCVIGALSRDPPWATSGATGIFSLDQAMYFF